MAEWRATSGYGIRDVRNEMRDTGYESRDMGYGIRDISYPELRVALFPPVSPVSFESGIGDCSRSVHE
jgi:hypothetical protein